MSAVFSPASHAQTVTDLGHAWVYAEAKLEALLTEELNVFGAGLVAGVGDLMGSGSDTLRLRHYTGIGAAESFQPMASETEEIVPTGFTTGVDTVTIARYGLAKEQTYQDAILQEGVVAEILALDKMVDLIPASWMSTVRGLWGTTISTFADVVGTAGAPWTVDDELELLAYFREIEGYDPRKHGLPVSGRGVKQLTQLRNGLRNEPYLQASAETLNRLLGVGEEAGGGFEFYGMRNVGTHDVATNGGDAIGGAYIPGAVAYCVASTTPAPVQDPTRSLFLHMMGLVMESRSNDRTATARLTANAWLGMAKRSASLFPQCRVRSINS